MKKEQKSGQSGPELSNEFKSEIKIKRQKSTFPAVFVTTLILIVTFAVLGFGVYEIFFKGEEIEQQSRDDKIISKPEEDAIAGEKNNETIAPTPVATPEAAKPAPTPNEYTVVEGDTLGAIAVKFGVTVEALKSLNGITDETLLQIGQKLKIPN